MNIHNNATIKCIQFFKSNCSSKIKKNKMKYHHYDIIYFIFQTKAHLDILAEALLRWARGRWGQNGGQFSGHHHFEKTYYWKWFWDRLFIRQIIQFECEYQVQKWFEQKHFAKSPLDFSRRSPKALLNDMKEYLVWTRHWRKSSP